MNQTHSTLDSSVLLTDSSGRLVSVDINGASVDELIALGYSRQNARNAVAENQAQNAIARGELSEECWIYF